MGIMGLLGVIGLVADIGLLGDGDISDIRRKAEKCSDKETHGFY